MEVFKVFRTTKRRFKTERITLSWSSFSRIWMKPKCNLPPKWSARRRSLSWRPRYAEQTSHTRSFCCWKLDAGIEFRYSSYREARKPTQMSGNLHIDTTLQGSPCKESKPTLTQRRCHTNALWAQLTRQSVPARDWWPNTWEDKALPVPVSSLH